MTAQRWWTSEDVQRVMDRLGCERAVDRDAAYCVTHQVGWLSDVDACARADGVLDALTPAIAARDERIRREGKAEALRKTADILDEATRLRPNPDGREFLLSAAGLRKRADVVEREPS